MLESKFQASVIKEIRDRFPGCDILKNDASIRSGIPDLLILYKTKWAMLECKQTKNSKKRPNQEYYINLFNKMSYASFIYKENRKEVMHELELLFAPER